MTEDKETIIPHPLISFLPIMALVGLLAITISLFGSDALSGGSQLSLLTASAICVCISALVYKTPWVRFESHIKATIGDTCISIIILLIIGMMSGSWMISGVVPTFIYYGVQIMSPQYFLVSCCIICAIISLVTGSSWTTIATIGIAMIGIGRALGIPDALTAGAIISGAYFGDKMSPLSDTTVLAATASGTDLFTHIRYMVYTTVPSILITIIMYFIAGFWYSGTDIDTSEYTTVLADKFNITGWVLVVPIITGIIIAKKVPSVITLFVSALLAGMTAVILQPHILAEIADDGNIFKGLMVTYFTSTNVETGSEAISSLVSTGGMHGMLDTIWLILCAMTFGACMIASGMLQSITKLIVRGVTNLAQLVSSTVLTGLVMNIVTGDQYMSIVLTASMYKDAYDERNYAPELLSRTSEDAATVTSVLIPWNTCGMTQATVLGVPTIAYLPFCFFNIISPFMSCVVAALNIKIRKKKK